MTWFQNTTKLVGEPYKTLQANGQPFYLPPESYSTEIMMVRLVPGLPAPLGHPGFSIPWQEYFLYLLARPGQFHQPTCLWKWVG